MTEGPGTTQTPRVETETTENREAGITIAGIGIGTTTGIAACRPVTAAATATVRIGTGIGIGGTTPQREDLATALIEIGIGERTWTTIQIGGTSLDATPDRRSGMVLATSLEEGECG